MRRSTLPPVPSVLGGLRSHCAPRLSVSLSKKARATPGAAAGMPLSAKDESLVRLFVTACYHQWDKLPGLGRRCLDAGTSAAELRGCVRHIAIIAGYPLCLATTNVLRAENILTQDLPGKAGGLPGNAFDLVYERIAGRVWSKLYAADGVVAEWIRLHAYGDIYSSPGLDLRQKQLLTAAFLSEADMPTELFGHLLAAMRFGADEAACKAAISIAFSASPAVPPPHEEHPVYQNAMEVLRNAASKVHKYGIGQPPEVSFPEPGAVRVPTRPGDGSRGADTE